MMPNKQNTKKKKSNKKAKKTGGGGAKRLAPMAVAYTAPRNQYKLNGKNQFTLEHSELVDVFVGAPNFAQGLVGYRINPGNTNLFPWLGSIAPAFEKYHFRKLQFRWVPHCPTTAAGVVSMAVDYDAADELPGDRTVMMSYKTRTTAPPHAEARMACDGGDLKSTVADRYVLAASFMSPDSVVYPFNVDKRLYDLGYLYISVESNFAENCGDLWVDYVVDLKQPDFITASADACVAHGHTTSGGTKNDPLGVMNWDWLGSSFTGMLKSAANNRSLLKLPRGLRNFILELVVAGTGLNNAVVNATLTDSLGADRKEYGEVATGMYTGSDTSWYKQFAVDVGDVSNDVYLGIDTTAATTVGGVYGLYMYPKPPY